MLSGLLLCLSWWGSPFFIFIALVPLLFMMQQWQAQRPLRAAAPSSRFAYLAFVLWNAGVTWWIWNSTAIGAVLAIVVNTLLMAWVVWAYVFSAQSFKDHFFGVYLLAVYWLAFEFFHQNWSLSWPWLQLGNVFAPMPRWVQWYEYTGVLGGSLWIWLVNILLYSALRKMLRQQTYVWSLAKALLWLLLPLAYSYHSYQHYQAQGKRVEVVVVQPNMDPWHEQFYSQEGEVVQRIERLSSAAISPHTALLVAPESALTATFELPEQQIDYPYTPNSNAVRALKAWANRYPHMHILVGASTFSRLAQPSVSSRLILQDNIDQYNTAMLMDARGITAYYHKSKLVPGVERLPFASLLAPVQSALFDLGGAAISLGASEQPHVFAAGHGIVIAPLVCYESIYGDYTSLFVRQGANLLTVITNDGWWGQSPGYRQHLNLARLRCVEFRRDMARSANTGVSAFINQRGDIISQTPYWEQAVDKADLRLNTKMTFYAMYGDFIGRIAAFVAILFFLIAVSRRLQLLKPHKV